MKRLSGAMRNLPRDLRWWIADYIYAGWWQVRGALGRSAESYLEGSLRPIIVLPGIYESWYFMRPTIDRLHDAGHPVHVVSELSRNRRPVDAAADLVAAFIAERNLRDVVIVAHSKGGLIGKYVMAKLDPDSRIPHMVAISTPFSGSIYAQWMLLPSLRSFSPKNALTLALSKELTVNERITSVFGLFDPHIPRGSELTGADNRVVETGGHFRILDDERVIDIVTAIAARPGRD
ncbi:esterase/lipase family protein [Marisediminicola sp. LYQ85]|uniref:esterase/lipase family protein n=1 Tax=Marisediminicola sp. LYQ85 TaxID=3391062 RepID=UPI00398347FD